MKAVIYVSCLLLVGSIVSVFAGCDFGSYKDSQGPDTAKLDIEFHNFHEWAMPYVGKINDKSVSQVVSNKKRFFVSPGLHSFEVKYRSESGSYTSKTVEINIPESGKYLLDFRYNGKQIIVSFDVL